MDSVEIQRQKLGRRWTRGGCRKLSYGSRRAGCRENRHTPLRVACMSLNICHSPAASSFKAELLVPAFPHYPGFIVFLFLLFATLAPKSPLYLNSASLDATELSTFSTLPNATVGSASDRVFLRTTLSGVP